MPNSRYRLCWCACAALVLLRVAVGWHFLYEGLWKIESWRAGTEKFSAENYIAKSSGPLRTWFRSHLDDPDGLERLQPAGVIARWDRTIAELDRKYSLTDEQKSSAQKKVRELELAKEAFFTDSAIKSKIDGYREGIEEVAEDKKSDPAFVREHAGVRRKELIKTRDELLDTVDAWNKSLHDHVIAELNPDQIERESTKALGGLAERLNLPFDLNWSEDDLYNINRGTMLGLTVCGGLLVIGLFSRLSALGAALLVASFYACNPPPPLGAGMPGDPGHYLYVNKELVECLAALVLATIPTGRWLGADALIRGLVTRRLSAAVFGTPDDAVVKS
jgi:uncharacterized membrane protein YphA (DoxX/SURF4 family)